MFTALFANHAASAVADDGVEVQAWLASLSLAEYAHVFVKERFDTLAGTSIAKLYLYSPCIQHSDPLVLSIVREWFE